MPAKKRFHPLKLQKQLRYHAGDRVRVDKNLGYYLHIELVLFVKRVAELSAEQATRSGLRAITGENLEAIASQALEEFKG